MKAVEKVEKFKRQLLAELLEQLYSEQLEKFNKIYPAPISEFKLMDVIDLCERTVAKNILN